jgi:hypothetical protein
MIETREHKLARLALDACVSKVFFGDVITFTDRPGMFHDISRVVKVEDWPTKEGWSRFLWNEVPLHVRTSHMLVIQWDSWVVDPGMWRADFERYDYIGAPWWYTDGLNVGNGGFSLRSTALMRFVRDRRAIFPCVNAWDDDQLCRKYRPTLQERYGFVWAPGDVASAFSFECVPPKPEERQFGFHGIFNWPKVINGDDIGRRVRLASESRYIRGTKNMWDQLVKAYPEAGKYE